MKKRIRPRRMMNGVEKNISRWVMEDFLGRELTSREMVHHKDENPANNSIENLQLMSAEEHNIHHHLNKKRGPLSSETKKKIGLSHQGMKASDEAKRKMSINNRHRRLCLDDIIQIKKMLRDKVKSFLISFVSGISQSHISNIKIGRKWGNI